MQSFSKRHGYTNKEVKITVREDAPSGLRCFIIDMAEEDCSLSPSSLRQVICRVLNESPDRTARRYFATLR